MPHSEQDLLDVIDRIFPNAGPGVLLGRGDDCAVLDPGGVAVLSTDLFVEDVHFRRSYFSAGDIGHKALAAAASDLAGMGARPLCFALSLTVPGDADDAFLGEMLAGMGRLAGRLHLPLAGGDLSRGPKLILDVVVTGRPGPGGRLLERRKAKPGDVLFLVGEIGLARAGLLELERHGRPAVREWPAATAAHLRPEPRIAAGLALAGLATPEGPAVSGLMDVSDGLARDLPRFLGKYGADLTLRPQDLHPEVRRRFSAAEGGPVAEAVLGGEDYALLGCAKRGDLPAVLAELPQARAVGSVSETPGVRLADGRSVGPGFDHFK